MKSGHELEYALKVDIDLGKDDFDKENGYNHDQDYDDPSYLDEFCRAKPEDENVQECANDEAEISTKQKKYSAECEQVKVAPDKKVDCAVETNKNDGGNK
jgi:hypothetical protein